MLYLSLQRAWWLTRVRRLGRLHVGGRGEDRRLRGLVLRDEERRAANVVVAHVHVHGSVPVVGRRGGRPLPEAFLPFARPRTLVQKLSTLTDFVLSLKRTTSNTRDAVLLRSTPYRRVRYGVRYSK